MQKFTTLTARAAHLAVSNVDTDMIIPKQFLKTIKRTGLGKNLFDEMRFTLEGKEIESFVLNKPAFRGAQILVSGENFGCGSSREHAPWAILDFGIRCIIAESYADIFYNNCFKNGILPIMLPKEQVARLGKVAEAEDNEITVDLVNQTVSYTQNSELKTYNFTIDSFRKHCLLNGLDDIGLTLEKAANINAYETEQKTKTPWLF